MGASLSLMIFTLIAHHSGALHELSSFYVALSPFFVFSWLSLLALLSLRRSARHAALSSLLIALPFALYLWPVSWLFRAESALAPPPQLRLSTWNVERLGELDFSEQRAETLKSRLGCVSQTLKGAESQLFALQEISKRRMRALERQMGLKCRHVDYFGVGGSKRGGLATCAALDSPWQISKTRDFALGGDWRALFVEVKGSAKRGARGRFNILNVHFRPHGVSASDVQLAAEELAHGSPKALSELLRRVVRNMRRQEEQVEGLLKAIGTLSDPTLIVGDFNAPAYTSLHRAFAEAGDGAWVDAWSEVGVSFGATRYFEKIIPPLRVDFIYALKRGFELGSVSVSAVSCSDHRPLHLRATLKGLGEPSSGL